MRRNTASVSVSLTHAGVDIRFLKPRWGPTLHDVYLVLANVHRLQAKPGLGVDWALPTGRVVIRAGIYNGKEGELHKMGCHGVEMLLYCCCVNVAH